MEFASSHIYVSYPDNANQIELPAFNKNHPIGTVRNNTTGEDPVPHLYAPITASSTEAEDKKPVEAPFYDPVEGGDPVYDNWTPEIAVIASKSVYDNTSGVSPNTEVHDQAVSNSAAPSITTTAEQVYDVAEGSGSYYEKRRTSNSQTVQHPTNPPPLPAPRRRIGSNTNGPPPPLPPRPRNLKHVPDYVEVIDSTPIKGFEHQALPTPCAHLQAPTLPDRMKPEKNVPTYCQSCSAAMSTFSKVQDLHATMWRCEFCNKNNVLDYRSNEARLGDDQIYIHVPNPVTAEDIDDKLVVFCVDISGSMSVTFEVNRGSNCKSLYMSRLQAMQEAVAQSLDYLFQTSPRTRVSLVTFNNEVTIYGDGLTSPQTLQDFELIDQNYLKTQGGQAALPHCILESRDALHHHIHQLQECGATALGPAALVSIAMASQKQGSKVIICTDGRANTILGNLEDIKDDKIYQSSKFFYNHLAEYAMTKGVIVSILTIEGTDCRLPELGQLADKTGGKVNITNPADLYTEFQLILEDDIIATNVTTTFIVDDGLYFKYEDDISSKNVKHVGNVVKDMEITFEFGIKESKLEEIQKKTELPFQLQIGFRFPDGRCAYRTITQVKPITNHSAIVKDHINLSVLQIHTAQISARLAMEGRMQDAQKEALAQKELIEEIVAKRNDLEQGAIYESWVQSMSPIYSALKNQTQDGVSAQPLYEALSTKRDRESVVKSFTDDIANVVYRLKNAKKKMLKKPKFMVAL
ncbi:circularly permutated Ras protein 1-like isoform X2 [Scyliorhinus canicula]|uniref:circularly permutated Ras protein 1-like isoform X2 n=1 Tax=Scyliorhinus canicula TaxID=7830 RepID=UPI0018F3E563|nr:circularly permutated Ras protein 1-like isoform X2 [Scyliorhinus canicula]